VKTEAIQKSCWRRNGVWGTELPRCEKLRYVNHCRNCEVFEAAAEEAFSASRKAIDDGELIDESDIERQALLPFRLSTYCLSVPANSVLTISGQVALHSIPFNANSVVKGLVAINQEVYPLLDMSALLCLDAASDVDKLKKLRGLYKRILVVNFENQSMAFYVDEVYQIHHFTEHYLLTDSSARFVRFTNGYLKNNDAWCDNCHLLNLSELSMELEKRPYV